VLTNLLNHEDSLVRAKAVASLAPLAGNHIKGLDEALKKCLLDPVRNVRYEAEWALRENVETNSIAGLEMLQTIGNYSEQPAGQVQVALWELAHGQTDSALAHYTKAITWDPYSPPIRIDYAVALSSAGKSSNALVQIKEACRLAPNDADNFFRLGLVWNEVGDLDHSIAALEEAARLNPHHDRALYNLGLAYGQSGNFVKAIESLTLAESANRFDARAGYAKATILARMGRNTDAIAALRGVLKIQPDFPEARLLLHSLTP
jgi:tetratricopeptide (TPR) repeat protein